MEYRQSLARRIVIAFMLMTVLVAGVFGLGIVEIVHSVEERLMSSGMGSDLDRLLQMESVDDWRHQPEPQQLFYFSDGWGDFAMPEDLRDLPPGFHEVFRGAQTYHAIVREVDGRRYVLLEDQSEFEEREQALFSVVLIGVLLSVALAGALGWLLARRVMAPVVRLAGQVRHRDQLLALAPPLVPDYAEDEVGQLAAAFDDTLGRLRLVLKRERLFTSDVSHELRTPLMVMASSCELLLENPHLDPRGRSQLQRMARACEQMGELVQTFLLLAREQRKEADLAPRATLAEIADELVEQWRPTIEAKGLRLDYRRDEPQQQRYNASFLRTVMSNLLRNAWHYTEHGHISLVVEGSCFQVEDSGAGIPLGERESVFQPFVRGSDERGDGLGLGLSLVQRICELQDWAVTLSPVEPNGCRFSVRLTATR
nr:HAMP domain-containing sensor histidine kinase [uncultured Pseudomonas sp.]